jgi:hypothetical protein
MVIYGSIPCFDGKVGKITISGYIAFTVRRD